MIAVEFGFLLVSVGGFMLYVSKLPTDTYNMVMSLTFVLLGLFILSRLYLYYDIGMMSEDIEEGEED